MVREHDIDGKPPLIGHLAAKEQEGAADKFADVAPKIDEDGAEGAKMHHDVGELALIGPPGQSRNENKMA